MKKALRIALIIKNFVATGGAERYAVEAAQRMVENGHEIDLYAREIDGSLTRGMTVFRIPEKMMFSSVLALHSFSRGVLARMEGKMYDVVHSHDKGCRGDISTIHTFSFMRGMGTMSLLKKINEFFISPRAWLYIHMERQQASSSRLVAVSDVIREDLQDCHRRFGGISVIPPGVDIDVFSPLKIAAMRASARREQGLAPDETAVLFVGSEFRRKGLDNLIPAIDRGMKLFVVGRQEKMEHYTRLVAEYGLGDRVVFTGLTDNVLRYYALADVLVLPSLAEAFGMTVLEAMACGIPVVTSRAAGCSCLIDSGRNGIVFDSPDQLPGILKDLKNKTVRDEIGRQGRETASAHTWDETAARYERLYYEIAEEKKSARLNCNEVSARS
ncbi:MAG: glycosyltransferase family 4 protein [Desulfobacter sp.]|nr:MAG: glycosyltransferase family 4 protein [Desulfobacter sp.]